MKGINSDVISEVRSRCDIVEVVSEVVVLKRAGKLFKGLCPFHGEKTPSFIVNPDRGIFKCFGCGEGGDVFAFITKTKKVAFPEAVRELAAKAGVVIPESVEERETHDRRSLFMLLYQQSCEYFRRLLQDPAQGAIARDYLQRRGITDEIVEKFQLGYAPGGWDGLLSYLTQANKVSPDTLLEAGLVRNKAETNRYYDLFRNRLMVPICDDQGRVIAFGGRTLVDDQVKYINSPESPIYTKGDNLFGLHVAKDTIKLRDSVVVVEGYFDAITAHQFGFTQTVAALGTALTERQAKLLVRYTDRKRVYMCFDADAAGEKALERGVETMMHIAEGIGIELKVLKLEGAKDPDECLRGQGPGQGPLAFQQAINSAPFLIDYRLESAIQPIDIKSQLGRIEAAKLLVPHLAGIGNTVARGEYIRQWAHRVGVREEELLADVGQYRRQHRAGTDRPPIKDMKTKASRHVPQAGCIDAEKKLLALYFTDMEDHKLVTEQLAEDRFIDPIHERIKLSIEGVGNCNNVKDLEHRVLDRLVEDSEAIRVLADVFMLSEELRKQNSPTMVIVKDSRARILRELIISSISKFRAQLSAESNDDKQALLQSKIMQLTQIEQRVLPSADTQEHLAELRHKIDSLILETTP